MSQGTIEERVARLEQMVDCLLKPTTHDLQPERDAWRRTFGIFADDRVMKEIIDAGKRIRDDDRRNTNR